MSEQTTRGDEESAVTESETGSTTVLDDGAEPRAIAPDYEAVHRSRVRVGALVWALVAVALAGWMLLTIASPERRDALLEAVISATPLTAAIGLVLALGLVVLLIAGVALVRRAQRGLARRRAAASV